MEEWEYTEGDEEEEDEVDMPVQAEHVGIWMPSSMDPLVAKDRGLEFLMKEELELRKGQANDCLERLRLALGDKSVLARRNLRLAHSVRTTTRAFKDLLVASAKVKRYTRGYLRARAALQKLGADDATMARYRPIEPADLSVNKDITEENRYGQGSDSLPWIWRTGELNREQEGSTWMDECKS